MNRDQEKAMFANQGNRNKKLSKSSLSPGMKQTVQNVSGRRLKQYDVKTNDVNLEKAKQEYDRLWKKVFDGKNENYKEDLKTFEKFTRENLVPLSAEEFSDIEVFELTDPKDREKHGGYRFIVRDGIHAHSAYRTREGLDKFIERTGLELIPEESSWNGYLPFWKTKGKYKKVWLSGDSKMLDEFAKKGNMIKSEEMDNGDFTRSYIQKDKDGNTIYLLNPNYDREKLPYHHD